MELYLHTVPPESRTTIYLNSLDDSVFDVVANLGLTPQTELAVTLASPRTEFEPVQNVSISRWIFHARYQRTEEKVDDYFIAPWSLLNIAFPRFNDIDSILFQQFVDGMKNVEVPKKFLTKEPKTPVRARPS